MQCKGKVPCPHTGNTNDLVWSIGQNFRIISSSLGRTKIRKLQSMSFLLLAKSGMSQTGSKQTKLCTFLFHFLTWEPHTFQKQDREGLSPKEFTSYREKFTNYGYLSGSLRMQTRLKLTLR